MNSMMEDILLLLDKGDSGRDNTKYKKVLDGDDCGGRNEQAHVHLANKCNDNNDCNRASDVHRTDAGVFLNKESCPIENNPVKPKLSSAFMISSILSTKTVSSFSNNCSQASNSPYLKMTNNASDIVGGSDARIESSVAKTSELKHNATIAHSSLLKPNISAVDYRLEISQRRSSLEITNGHLSDDLPESAKEHTMMDFSTDVVETQGNEAYDLSMKTTCKKDDHDEDMQIEISSPPAAKNYGVSEINMDDPLADNESVASASEVKTKKTVDGKTVSTLRSDFHSKSDSCNEMHSECDESNNPNVTYHDLAVTDENTHINNVDSDLVTDTVDTDSNTIRVSKNETASEDNTTDLINDANLDKLDTQNNQQAPNDSTSPVKLDKSKLGSNNSEKNKYFKSTEISIVDSCVGKEFENSDNQKLARLEGNSNKIITAEDSWEKEQNLDKKGSNLPTEITSSFDPNCESKDFDSYTSVASDVIEMPLVENSPPTHSINVKDGIETNSSNSSQEIKDYSKKVTLLDKNVDLNEAFEIQNENTNIKGDILDVEKQKILNEKDKEETNKVDDEIVFVDETGRSEPGNSSAQKYTFKNILFKPKDNVTLNSEKTTSIVESSECLKSTETVIENKPLTTKVSKVEDKHNSKLKVILNTKKESVEGLPNNELTNERKRFQKGDVFSAPKRSRLDSVDDKEEKKAKDTASGVFDDDVTLAETSVASAEDKDVRKLKDDRTVSLSSEALQSLITLRVKAFIRNKKQANLDRLNLRTRGMQSASNLWKETAKHLERSVLELTALNQKLESRKAHLLAVKRLSSRSIGTQVIEENVNSSGSVTTVTPSPSGNPAQRNQPAIAQPAVQRTNRPGRPPLYHRPVSNVPATPSQPPAATQTEKIIQPPVNKTLDTQMQENSVNLIDLTEDEDISRNVVTKAPTPISQPVNRAVNKPVTGGKTAASTPGNGYVQPSRITQGTPVGSSNQTVQPSTSGSQPPAGGPTVGAAASQQQLVAANISAPQLSGANSTLISGSRPGAAANTYVSPGPSITPTNTRVLPQNSAPLVSSPAAVAASAKTTSLSLPPSFLISVKHPAPLPHSMDTGNAPPTAKKRPPKPTLKISRVSQGIVLSWNMPSLFDVEKISSYQLYAYQESDSVTPRSTLWKKVGEVSALPLPMACTLTQFQEGNKYHFAVRAVDQYGRCGSYSDPSSIYLGPKT